MSEYKQASILDDAAVLNTAAASSESGVAKRLPTQSAEAAAQLNALLKGGRFDHHDKHFYDVIEYAYRQVGGEDDPPDFFSVYEAYYSGLTEELEEADGNNLLHETNRGWMEERGLPYYDDVCGCGRGDCEDCAPAAMHSMIEATMAWAAAPGNEWWAEDSEHGSAFKEYPNPSEWETDYDNFQMILWDMFWLTVHREFAAYNEFIGNMLAPQQQVYTVLCRLHLPFIDNSTLVHLPVWGGEGKEWPLVKGGKIMNVPRTEERPASKPGEIRSVLE